MSAYEALAGVYDALTGDVGYERRADYLEKLLPGSRISGAAGLDLVFLHTRRRRRRGGVSGWGVVGPCVETAR